MGVSTIAKRNAKSIHYYEALFLSRACYHAAVTVCLKSGTLDANTSYSYKHNWEATGRNFVWHKNIVSWLWPSAFCSVRSNRSFDSNWGAGNTQSRQCNVELGGSKNFIYIFHLLNTSFRLSLSQQHPPQGWHKAQEKTKLLQNISELNLSSQNLKPSEVHSLWKRGWGYSFLNHKWTSKVFSFHFNAKSRPSPLKLQSPNALNVLKIISNQIKINTRWGGARRPEEVEKNTFCFICSYFWHFIEVLSFLYSLVCYD